MSFPILSAIQQRYLDLIGQPTGTIDSFGTRNINGAINDIVNRYSFSWNLDSADLTLAAGVADLPTDYNPRWGLTDARIVVSEDNNDQVFTQIPVYDRDKYSADDYVYWITPDPANNKYIFNSKAQTGTVTVYYNVLPTDLSAASDPCIVPDLEAVSYLAASKNWIGSERDTELKREYEQMAKQYIDALYFRDLYQGAEVQITSLALQLGE